MAKLEKYVSRPAFPKLTHQGTLPCKMGCWEDIVLCSDEAHETQSCLWLRPEEACQWVRSIKSHVSGGSPKGETNISLTKKVCVLEGVNCGLMNITDIPLLSNSTVFPSFPLLHSTLCVLPRVLYRCLISTSGSGPQVLLPCDPEIACLPVAPPSTPQPRSPTPFLKPGAVLYLSVYPPCKTQAWLRLGAQLMWVEITVKWMNDSINAVNSCHLLMLYLPWIIFLMHN